MDMASKQIRRQFLDFFAAKEHTIVDSSPVVPHDDPTLLFTNAGMNQFKDVFLATGSRSYKRAANTQKCIRAGGKHNDLDDVGQDTYHHTFFEMLGNWSFGDYFKKEAIAWAWELLTEVWGIEKSRLHATYFEGDKSEGLEPDTEAAQLWSTVTDIDPSHIHPGGKKDNFWEMGETGPCGPCSEIHVDLTPDKSGASLVNAGDARVIELWNLVFIQFNRAADGTLSPLPAKHVDTGMGFERLCAVLLGTERGKLGQTSNYDTDVFAPIFKAIQKRTGAPPYAGTLPDNEPQPRRDREGACDEPCDDPNRDRKEACTPEQVMIDVSYRVIADHVRCLVFALTDGAYPDNEGRGYVLRRILRRAVRYGRQYLNMHQPFLCDLVKPLVDLMADPFPELRTAHGRKNVEHVTELIRDEETSFGHTYERGMKLWWIEAGYALWNRIIEDAQEVANSSDRLNLDAISGRHAPMFADDPPVFDSDTNITIRRGQQNIERFRLSELTREHTQRYCSHPPIITGDAAFKLHDTYGFPVDLTKQIAEERGLTVDIGAYERLMEKAREKARTAGKPEYRSYIQHDRGVHAILGATNDGAKYEGLTSVGEVFGWAFDKKLRSEKDLHAGQEAGLVLKETCFYAEQGGQVGDTGIIETDTGMFEVRDTQLVQEMVVHAGIMREGTITQGQSARCSVHPNRLCTMKNHTATHLLNWALREVLGDHIQQKGSLVDPEKTRFDFSHNKAVSNDELSSIESLVNEKIAAEFPVYTKDVDKNDALKINTLRAVFGETYPDEVRVVSAGADIDEMLEAPKDEKWMQYAVEFCGGTHLKNTEDVEDFVLTSEEAVAKGIRRVVGVTGEAARKARKRGAELLAEAGALAGKPPGEVVGGAHPTGEKVGGAHATDFGARLAAFQQSVNDAVIPISVRHRLREMIGELQQVAKEEGKKAAAASGDAVRDEVASLLQSAETIAGVTVLAGAVPAAPPDALRAAIDWVRNKTEASAVLLATADAGKVTLIAGMSKAVVKKGIKAGDLIKEIAPLVGGRGGGRPDMAQGGGNDPTGIPQAVDRAKVWINQQLAGGREHP